MPDTNMTEIGGLRTEITEVGSGPEMLLLHGGIPGVVPYCGGRHLWGDTLLDRLAARNRLVLPGLPGCGGTEAPQGGPTIDNMVDHAVAVLTARTSGAVHLVGHDVGAMVAMFAAMQVPERIACLTIVTSQALAPTGDGIRNLTFLSPPQPQWTSESQRWAYERISYSHFHIDSALIDASVQAAAATTPAGEDTAVSIFQGKNRFLGRARETGVPVPTQVIWAANDPLVNIDHGIWLHRIIAGGQRRSQFHLINRSGNLPFREQSEEFLRLLTSFQDGVAADT